MQNRLFLLSFCILLSGCVHGLQQSQDLYAQSELLPPKSTSDQPSLYQAQYPTLNLQGQQTPPIVVPQQTTLPPHVFTNPQIPVQPTSQNNPTPFVQTIVIPQAAPYSYPNMIPAQQPTPIVTHAINGQSYPTQGYQNQVPTYNVQNHPISNNAPSYPSQNSASSQNANPIWAAPQNVQQIQSETAPKSLNAQNSNLENIPRW